MLFPVARRAPQIDARATSHPAVALSLSFSIPNAFWGHEIACAIVLNPADSKATATGSVDADVLGRRTGSIENTLMVYLSEKMMDYKVPRQIFVVSEEQLPKSATGKYLRRRVAQALEARAVDNQALNTLSSAAPGAAATLSPVERRLAALEEGPRFVPSTALSGVRVVTAFWVAQMHIGAFPTQGWELVRNAGMDLPIFTFLGIQPGRQDYVLNVPSHRYNSPSLCARKLCCMDIYIYITRYLICTFPWYMCMNLCHFLYCSPGGFMLSASASRPVTPAQTLDFLTTRIGALHAIMVVAILFSIPMAVVVCQPNMREDYWDSIVEYNLDVYNITDPNEGFQVPVHSYMPIHTYSPLSLASGVEI